jgi:hypothetical protein
MHSQISHTHVHKYFTLALAQRKKLQSSSPRRLGVARYSLVTARSGHDEISCRGNPTSAQRIDDLGTAALGAALRTATSFSISRTPDAEGAVGGPEQELEGALSQRLFVKRLPAAVLVQGAARIAVVCLHLLEAFPRALGKVLIYRHRPASDRIGPAWQKKASGLEIAPSSKPGPGTDA